MLIQLLVLQIVTFAGIIFVLRFLFYRQLNSSLSRLKDLYEENLIKENRLKEELERAKQVSLSEIEKGKQQGESVVEAAKKEAEELRINLKEQAKQEAQKIIVQGKEDLEKTKIHQMAEIEDKAIALSLQMIKYAFTQQGKENLHHLLIEELIRDLRAIDKNSLVVTTHQLKIITPFPLNAREREEIKQILAEKIGSDIALEERIDHELITGLMIQVGELVIDGSFKTKLKKIIPYLKKE